MRLDGQYQRRRRHISKRCANGHIYTPENTLTRTQHRFNKATQTVVAYQFRKCRRCFNVRKRVWARKNWRAKNPGRPHRV